MLAVWRDNKNWYLAKIQEIYGIVKDVYNAYNQADFVEKWSLFGRSIGKGIKLLKGDNSLPASLCRRRFKKFRKQ